MHVGLILIYIPQFLTDGLVNIIILDVGHFGVNLGMLGSSVCHKIRNLRVGEGRRCFGNDHRLAAIAVRCAEIPFRFLHCPVKLLQGYHSKIKDLPFQITASTLEVGIILGHLTLGHLAPCLLDPVPFWLGGLSLNFLSLSLWITTLRRSGCFFSTTPSPF